jgi:hypothetical protein
MTLATVLTYVLLALGIALVALGVSVVARQLLAWDTRRESSTGAPAPYLSALVIVIGIASLGTSAVISLNKPASTEIVSAPSTTPAASTPAASTPTSPAPTVVTSSASSSPPPTGAVVMSAPAPGSKVQECDVFTGTSSLPSGETIVIGVRNLDDTGDTSYLEPVNNWDKPSALPRWTGFQYFGSGDSSVGQTYLVTVIVMPSGVVKSALAQPANRTAWAVTSPPAGSTVKQSLHLNRVQGQGPDVCR